MKIDIYSHILTERYRDALFQFGPKKVVGRQILEAQTTLWDLDARFRMMDKYEGYKQCVSMVGLPIETVATGRDAIELARIANDEMAALVDKYPERFVGGTALLPLGDIEASLKELDRAVNVLKLSGLFVHTPIYFYDTETGAPGKGKALDSPELIPIYEALAKYDVPLWVHPNSMCDGKIPDYSSENESKYYAWQIYGWPYQDTLAQLRLVFSGIMEKIPNLKVINHHAGAMIPFFEARLKSQFRMHGGRDKTSFPVKLGRHPLDYFRRFYADTAVGGSTPALMCAYAFYGAEHLLFATDVPFDAELGEESLRETIKSIDGMDISAAEKSAIYEGNALKLLRLD